MRFGIEYPYVRRLRVCSFHVTLASLALFVVLAVAPGTAAEAREAASRRTTVAVLWFENKAAEPQAAHWRYSIAGLIMGELQEVKALKVRTPSALDYAFRQLNTNAGAPVDAAQARQMGEFIEAQRVVWGSYERDNDTWRVRSHIIHVATGETSAELTATSNDWFQLRDELAERILSELGEAPSEDERQKMKRRWTASSAAFEWYSKAFALQQEGEPLSQQEHCARQAVAADPQSVRAHVALAATLGSQGKLEEAETAVRQALRMEPDSAAAHEVLGHGLLLEKKWEEGERELREAERLDPDSPSPLVLLGQLHLTRGEHDEMLEFLERARLLDPFDASIRATLGLVYALKRNLRQARVELKEVERLAPEGIDAMGAEQLMCQAYMLLGELPQAMDHCERFLALARPHGLNPEALRYFEEAASHLRTRLTPTFVETSMPKVYTEQALQEALRDRLTDEQRQALVNPLTGTAQMKRWARQLTEHADSDLTKAKALFEGLMRPIISEGEGRARTAQQTFAAWDDPNESFSCQEYAKLFIVLARDVDLSAFYVHLGTDYKGRTVNHDCAVVFTDGGALLVDPAYRWFGIAHKDFVVLDDLQAIAHQHFQSPDVASCRLAARLHPDFAWGQLRLARALLEAHQIEQAREALRIASELAPDRWDVHGLQGVFALRDDRPEAAAVHLKKALAANPESASSHFFLAAALLRQGHPEQAREHYRACLRHGPTPQIAGEARRAIAHINEQIGSD